jgi:hypothetical protein
MNPDLPKTPWSLVNRTGLGWFVQDADGKAIAWVHTHELKAENAMLPIFRDLVDRVNQQAEQQTNIPNP